MIGEEALRLRALATHAEDLGLVPSTPFVHSQLSITPVLGGPMPVASKSSYIHVHTYMF